MVQSYMNAWFILENWKYLREEKRERNKTRRRDNDSISALLVQYVDGHICLLFASNANKLYLFSSLFSYYNIREWNARLPNGPSQISRNENGLSVSNHVSNTFSYMTQFSIKKKSALIYLYLVKSTCCVNSTMYVSVLFAARTWTNAVAARTLASKMLIKVKWILIQKRLDSIHTHTHTHNTSI